MLSGMKRQAKKYQDAQSCRTKPPLPVFLICVSPGMTNRPDLIDDALMRPGRFEVKMEISKCSLPVDLSQKFPD